MTEQELCQICECEQGTLIRVERNTQIFSWYEYRRVTTETGQGKTYSVYLMAHSKVATLPEQELLRKLASIPRN